MAEIKQTAASRLVLFRGILLLFSLIASLVFAEIFLRLLMPQPKSWLAIYRQHPALPFYSMLPNKRLHVDTGETAWTITTDENGFRFNPDLQKNPSCTALWLGDSYAFGHGLDYPESFVGNIDLRLATVDVLNASVSGYGPIQYRQTLEYLINQGIKFDHLIVASYVGNDFHDTQWAKTTTVKDGIAGNRNDLKSILMRNLHLYRLGASLHHRFSRPKPASYRAVVEQLARPKAWEEAFLVEARSLYETEMSRILQMSRDLGTEPIFLILPTRQGVSVLAGEAPAPDPMPASGPQRQPNLPIEKAEEIFDRIGARHLDLTPVIARYPTQEMFFQFDGHLTGQASAKVADAILDAFALGCEAAVDAR